MSLYDEDRFQIAVGIVLFLSAFFVSNRYYATAYKLKMITLAPQRAEMLFRWVRRVMIICGVLYT